MNVVAFEKGGMKQVHCSLSQIEDIIILFNGID